MIHLSSSLVKHATRQRNLLEWRQVTTTRILFDEQELARGLSELPLKSASPGTRCPLPAYKFSREEQISFDNARSLIDRLKSQGCISYIVGGWVRDKFLGVSSADIDIATSASMAQLREAFKNQVEVLPRNTVRIFHNGDAFEVASFRGSRREADASSAAMDAGSRDFTINALFYDVHAAEVIDYVGGVRDVQSRQLRLCLDSVERLLEDPIRVLRAVRFMVVYRMKASPTTMEALKEVAPRCSAAAGQPGRRLFQELKKLHQYDLKHPGTFLSAMKLAYHLGLLTHLFPYLNPSNLEKAVRVLERLPRDLPLELRLAAMAPPSANKAVYDAVVSNFRFGPDSAPVFLLSSLVRMHQSPSVPDAHWIQFYASPFADQCIEVLTAWTLPSMVDEFKEEHRQRRERLATRIKKEQAQANRWKEAIALYTQPEEWGTNRHSRMKEQQQAKAQQRLQDVMAVIQTFVDIQQEAAREKQPGPRGKT